MTGNEDYFAAAIKYVRPFKQGNLTKYVWKQTQGDEYINSVAPCFSGKSIEVLFYCENDFRDTMATMGKPPEVWFEQLKMLLHGLAKDIWLEVLNEGDPKDNGAGFIKEMEQYIL